MQLSGAEGAPARSQLGEAVQLRPASSEPACGNLAGAGRLFHRLRLDRNQPGVVEAYPGQQIRLTCRAEGFPPPTIEWQRDGQRLASPRSVDRGPGKEALRPVCAAAVR